MVDHYDIDSSSISVLPLLLTALLDIHPDVLFGNLFYTTIAVLAIVMLGKGLDKEQVDIHIPSFLLGIIFGNFLGFILIKVFEVSRITRYISYISNIIFLSMFVVTGLILIMWTNRIMSKPPKLFKQSNDITDQEFVFLKNRYYFYDTINSLIVGITFGIVIYAKSVKDNAISKYPNIFVYNILFLVLTIPTILIVDKIVTKKRLAVKFCRHLTFYVQN